MYDFITLLVCALSVDLVTASLSFKLLDMYVLKLGCCLLLSFCHLTKCIPNLEQALSTRGVSRATAEQHMTSCNVEHAVSKLSFPKQFVVTVKYHHLLSTLPLDLAQGRAGV